MANFNSKQYEWCDIKVAILGRVVTGLTAIEYEVEREMEALHAAGCEPHSIQRGQKKYKGNLGLLQTELDALNAAAKSTNPAYDVTDISFDAIITYGEGNASKTDTVMGIHISGFKKGMKTKDKYAEITLPFMALGVKTQ